MFNIFFICTVIIFNIILNKSFVKKRLKKNRFHYTMEKLFSILLYLEINS